MVCLTLFLPNFEAKKFLYQIKNSHKRKVGSAYVHNILKSKTGQVLKAIMSSYDAGAGD